MKLLTSIRSCYEFLYWVRYLFKFAGLTHIWAIFAILWSTAFTGFWVVYVFDISSPSMLAKFMLFLSSLISSEFLTNRFYASSMAFSAYPTLSLLLNNVLRKSYLIVLNFDGSLDSHLSLETFYIIFEILYLHSLYSIIFLYFVCHTTYMELSAYNFLYEYDCVWSKLGDSLSWWSNFWTIFDSTNYFLL